VLFFRRIAPENKKPAFFRGNESTNTFTSAVDWRTGWKAGEQEMIFFIQA
jgi:hypothetical protein